MGNSTDLVEVKFFACRSLDDYDKESPKYAGGIYFLDDGSGVARGAHMVAGPAPLDIVVDKTLTSSSFAYVVNTANIVEFNANGSGCSFDNLANYLTGPGNRAVRFSLWDNIDGSRKASIIELYFVSMHSDPSDSSKDMITLSNIYSNSVSIDTDSYLPNQNSTVGARCIRNVFYRVEIVRDSLKIHFVKQVVETPTKLLVDNLKAFVDNQLLSVKGDSETDATLKSLDERLDALDEIKSLSDLDEHMQEIDNSISNMSSTMESQSKAISDLSNNVSDIAADLQSIQLAWVDYDAATAEDL